jgi:hypothetical protein
VKNDFLEAEISYGKVGRIKMKKGQLVISYSLT